MDLTEITSDSVVMILEFLAVKQYFEKYSYSITCSIPQTTYRAQDSYHRRVVEASLSGTAMICMSARKCS